MCNGDVMIVLVTTAYYSVCMCVVAISQHQCRDIMYMYMYIHVYVCTMCTNNGTRLIPDITNNQINIKSTFIENVAITWFT